MSQHPTGATLGLEGEEKADRILRRVGWILAIWWRVSTGCRSRSQGCEYLWLERYLPWRFCIVFHRIPCRISKSPFDLLTEMGGRGSEVFESFACSGKSDVLTSNSAGSRVCTAPRCAGGGASSGPGVVPLTSKIWVG